MFNGCSKNRVYLEMLSHSCVEYYGSPSNARRPTKRRNMKKKRREEKYKGPEQDRRYLFST